MPLHRVKKERRCFTLFEILLVLFLLVLGIGWIGVEIPKAIRKEKFEKAVEEVVGKISLAEEIMLDSGCDVMLQFSKEGNQIFCTLNAATLFAKPLSKQLQAHTHICGIESVEWQGTFTNPVTLFFNGSLGMSPRGVLNLSGKGNEKMLYLKGYPGSTLKSVVKDEKKHKRPPYPSELFSPT